MNIFKLIKTRTFSKLIYTVYICVLYFFIFLINRGIAKSIILYLNVFFWTIRKSIILYLNLLDKKEEKRIYIYIQTLRRGYKT